MGTTDSSPGAATQLVSTGVTAGWAYPTAWGLGSCDEHRLGLSFSGCAYTVLVTRADLLLRFSFDQQSLHPYDA
jgi:hypothetical protein